ncbi:MAG: 3-alpha-hydroxysteroid dehydrogenase [Gammaproteobacteria bacterium]|nr:MAG: 3-alpha-hydroxysteroid dehydrogenase [Gammaproteobacteria bacterium]
MTQLEGKVAIISGGARGQGEAEARLFVERGAKVVITDVLDNEGEKVAKDLKDKALYLHQDVTQEESWESVVKMTQEHFGKVDILVNNAGILRLAPLAMTSLEDYMATINVNQVGVFLGMKAVVPAMTQAGGGSIVNISSIDGLVGMSMAVSYVASKFAVRGMTKVAALELGQFGIRVNSIHPGGVDTKMLDMDGVNVDAGSGFFSRVPLGRVGQAEDIAKLACFLASEESAYSTGSEFTVDGGMLCGFGLDTMSK